MSRIPKIGFGSSAGLKTLQDNKSENTWKKTSGSNLMSGFKRPSDDNVSSFYFPLKQYYVIKFREL